MTPKGDKGLTFEPIWSWGILLKNSLIENSFKHDTLEITEVNKMLDALNGLGSNN